jgi:GT2 family glycosyltransferase
MISGTTTGVTVVICTYQRPDSTVRVLESLAAQERRPDAVLVVDASADERTCEAVRGFLSRDSSNIRLRYWHVDGADRGLTRQRNFALDRVGTDLVAFFDDDVVLGANCLRELERVHRADETVVGVGCFAGPEIATPRALWRLRRRLQIVPSLRAGTYHRSGMSIPWEFDTRSAAVVEGDWLPGWGMMWKTAAARAARFHDGFAGYAQGEDLDFSLRLRRSGRLLMARGAELRHVPDPAGRPDPGRQGYMEIYNRYQIHRRGLPDRTAADVLRFVYAWTLDTIMLGRHILRGRQPSVTLRQIAGRMRAAHDLVRGR